MPDGKDLLRPSFRAIRYSSYASVFTAVLLSLAFGGQNLEELYVTTARHRLTDEERSRQVHAGGLFVCQPGPRGLAPRRFGWI